MTPAQRKLVSRIESRAARGGLPPTRADLAKLCELMREMDAELAQADRETRYVGSTVRLIDVLLERVSAGDSPKATCADYGFEWNRGPDLAPLVSLVRLREAVREFAANYPLTEYADWQTVLKALRRAGWKRPTKRAE
jgi:hypothetical protein